MTSAIPSPPSSTGPPILESALGSTGASSIELFMSASPPRLSSSLLHQLPSLSINRTKEWRMSTAGSSHGSPFSVPKRAEPPTPNPLDEDVEHSLNLQYPEEDEFSVASENIWPTTRFEHTQVPTVRCATVDLQSQTSYYDAEAPIDDLGEDFWGAVRQDPHLESVLPLHLASNKSRGATTPRRSHSLEQTGPIVIQQFSPTGNPTCVVTIHPSGYDSHRRHSPTHSSASSRSSSPIIGTPPPHHPHHHHRHHTPSHITIASPSFHTPPSPILRPSVIHTVGTNTPTDIGNPPLSPPRTHPLRISKVWNHHPKYYFDDGDIVFRVGSFLYRLHRHFFDHHSLFFHDLFCALDFDRSTDEAIVLSEVSYQDFDRLLSIFYPTCFTKPDLSTVDEWTSVLVLATKWVFKDIRGLAIEHLTSIASAVDKIVLGTKYDVHDWLAPSYKELCTRSIPLTVQEGERLGTERVVEVAQIRDELELMQVMDMPEGELNRRIAEVFHLSATDAYDRR